MFSCNVFNVVLCIVLEDVSSQAVQNFEVLYVSDMYLVCAVRFVSYVEQISEKKFFLAKTFSI